jgi:MFS family permease
VPSPDVRTPQLQGTPSVVQLGLRANWQQFTLLVIVNAFVGAMVGLERSIVPLLGHQVFGLASTTAVLSFIMSFGIVKALANLFAGRLGDRIGRKGILVTGWLAGLPVPLLIIFAPAVNARVILALPHLLGYTQADLASTRCRKRSKPACP